MIIIINYYLNKMIGWRTHMEDSHICDARLTDDVSLFGVFDGHGGFYFQ